MNVYENKENTEVRNLLEDEKIPFAVLYRVLGGPVKKVITDHKRIVIAHTAPVFPTWIWAPDDVTEAELDAIYNTIRAEFIPITEYKFNTKYEIAEYLIKRLKEDGVNFGIKVNIASYECPNPVPPKKQVQGHRDLLKENEVMLAARLIREASVAIGDVVLSEEESISAAKEQLQRQVLNVWRDNNGREVSFCDKRPESDEYTAVSQCYTPEADRGKAYAGQLIYEVCKEIIAEGKTPILYADADYVPSNKCYQNIGFKLKAKIAMIGPDGE
ncbi:GNAT family N-acetyltransferase [Butyrivibrio sp. MC2013]|uniref:GNAT family N-acetyltransferase n=1 Tax=Butyrivibrio sp. MC2013 TaxID=1280686 RepID=UPI00047ADEE8|nr:GNAT family N-acetyltransferase [Butyrivibrio sp. MC2013]